MMRERESKRLVNNCLTRVTCVLYSLFAKQPPFLWLCPASSALIRVSNNHQLWDDRANTFKRTDNKRPRFAGILGACGGRESGSASAKNEAQTRNTNVCYACRKVCASNPHTQPKNRQTLLTQTKASQRLHARAFAYIRNAQFVANWRVE